MLNNPYKFIICLWIIFKHLWRWVVFPLLNSACNNVSTHHFLLNKLHWWVHVALSPASTSFSFFILCCPFYKVSFQNLMYYRDEYGLWRIFPFLFCSAHILSLSVRHFYISPSFSFLITVLLTIDAYNAFP